MERTIRPAMLLYAGGAVLVLLLVCAAVAVLLIPNVRASEARTAESLLDVPSDVPAFLEERHQFGSVVYLHRVRVLRVFANGHFLVGGEEGPQLLVSPRPGAEKPVEGAVVNLQGVVERAPVARTLQREWKLDAETAKAVAAGGIHLRNLRANEVAAAIEQ